MLAILIQLGKITCSTLLDLGKITCQNPVLASAAFTLICLDPSKTSSNLTAYHSISSTGVPSGESVRLSSVFPKTKVFKRLHPVKSKPDEVISALCNTKCSILSK